MRAPSTPIGAPRAPDIAAPKRGGRRLSNSTNTPQTTATPCAPRPPKRCLTDDDPPRYTPPRLTSPTEHAGAPDFLQAREEPEAEEVAEREPDDGRAVGVGVVGLELRVGAVVQQALQHRRDL